MSCIHGRKTCTPSHEPPPPGTGAVKETRMCALSDDNDVSRLGSRRLWRTCCLAGNLDVKQPRVDLQPPQRLVRLPPRLLLDQGHGSKHVLQVLPYQLPNEAREVYRHAIKHVGQTLPHFPEAVVDRGASRSPGRFDRRVRAGSREFGAREIRARWRREARGPGQQLHGRLDLVQRCAALDDGSVGLVLGSPHCLFVPLRGVPHLL
mmetsp:Transcript_52035/g.122118  ORF Transcript_52035/g.122118 Transcript_52035/m.122118 type:complete len:206 (-) Transcript_52035:448-1065(-)